MAWASSARLGLALVSLCPDLPPQQRGRGLLPSHHVRTMSHRKYKVLGRNRRLGHPNESPAPITQVGKGPRTYAHFLVDEVSGQLDLLRKAPDGEHPQAGVRAGRRVPLKLHVRSRMLVYAFDVLAPCGQDTEE